MKLKENITFSLHFLLRCITLTIISMYKCTLFLQGQFNIQYHSYT